MATQRRHIAARIALLLALLALLASAVPLATPARASMGDSLSNGGFEHGLAAVQGCGMEGNEWGCFASGGMAANGFHDEMWDAVADQGKHSQLIKVNTNGLNGPVAVLPTRQTPEAQPDAGARSLLSLPLPSQPMTATVTESQGDLELVWSDECQGEVRVRSTTVECWEPQPPPQPDPMLYWHEPGAHSGLNPHDHGDPPPDWANEWSMANFGHPVIYGGDEATPNENDYKHQAYKGFSFTTGNNVELYVRFHAQSNPHGRSAAYHSYEVYARDEAGGISFWQGLQFFGWPEVPTNRPARSQEKPGSLGEDWPGRDQLMISTPHQVDWDNSLRCEQWYGRSASPGPDFGITLCGSTTLRPMEPGPEPDPLNQETWMLTGDDGLDRRIHVTIFGPPNMHAIYGQWYCRQKQPIDPTERKHGSYPLWVYGPTVDGPADCPDGHLPQYTADTFPYEGLTYLTGNEAQKQFPGEGIVTVPN